MTHINIRLLVLLVLCLFINSCNSNNVSEKSSNTEQLSQLKQLLDEGAITQKEYDDMKRDLLRDSDKEKESSNENLTVPDTQRKEELENTIDGHEYVDLGLPSGRLWAICNIGASMPIEHGDYFAWGETQAKSSYSSKTYKWTNRDEYHLKDGTTKYYYNGGYTKYSIDYYNFTDNKAVLEPEDDAATYNWGERWRMPTIEEMIEMIDGCSWRFAGNYGGTNVACWVGTSKKNYNTIVFPAAGELGDSGSPVAYNEDGMYWSSSMITEGDHQSKCAHTISFEDEFFGENGQIRELGLSVRAVVDR